VKGRKPKPTRLKVLTGNPGQRPLNADEPMPPRGRPTCPAWLPKEAKAKWRKLVPMLDQLGLLTLADADTLAAYCVAWSELKAATDALERDGRMIEVPVVNRQGEEVGQRTVAHPAITHQRSALAAIRQYSALFGLDPSSRVRLKAPRQGGEEQELDQFIG
jgi:P27 family predicted phage terminase small subunit